jgi:hypothetical protein
MDLNVLKSKKSLKIVALLATSLIIASVSAATYSELYINGTSIGISAAAVQFTAGDDTATLGGGDAINSAGTTVTFDSFPSIEAGATVTYPEAVNLTNSAGSTKTITVTVDSITGNFDTNFDYLYVQMVAANGTSVGTRIEEVSTGSNVTSTGATMMLDTEVWAFSWELKASSGATAGQSFAITLKVLVE